tara:strand:+ start:943 stop:1158 length:216 start_codon:yes stop_codon:yes gene_type:complete
MKSWDQFRLDAYWAYNAIAEAEGFKSGAEKRQKQREALKKNRRKDKLTAKELRAKKLDSLLGSERKWKNLR